MADKTAKRPRLDVADKIYDFLLDEKVAQCLAKYSSTVFACETSADTRYIKCDFPCCTKHGGNQEGKPPWILNTLRNVRALEKHIGKEVAQFTKENISQSFDQNSHGENSREIIASQSLRPQTKKVLAVFNLADPQSLLGEWIALFLNAAQIKYGRECCDIEVITQSFTSRYELMSCITKLGFIKRHALVDVIAMLSCHSSSQGQVFSCTPSAVSSCFKYEEFCSLHDFVQVLQDTLGQSLSAIHVSSCFTLKLDCSHQDWPVDVDWLKKKLNCNLSGSTKEVYETGSQVADLYVSLSTLLNDVKDEDNLGDTLKNTIHSARVEAFPDLAHEMGLEILSPQDVGRKASSPCTDEGVSAPGQVNSSLHVVILIGYDSSDNQSQETHQALADALAANLNMRQMSDIQCNYSLLPLHDGKTCWKERLHSCIHSVVNIEEKVFVVALGSCWTHVNQNLLDIIQKEIYSSNRLDCCYGIHFQEISSMQAYFLKTRLNSINSCLEGTTSKEKPHIVLTALVKDERSCPVNTFPVLLYMIHLAIGENGERISGKGLIPAHLKYKQYRGPGISHWTLEDVYMETSYVLSGLSRKAGLCLLSLPTTSHAKALSSDTTAAVVNNKESQAQAVLQDMERLTDVTFDSHENLDIISESTPPSINSCFTQKENSPSESTSQSSNYISCSSEHENHVIQTSTCESGNDIYTSDERTRDKETTFNKCCQANSCTCEVVCSTEGALLHKGESLNENCRIRPLNATLNDCGDPTIGHCDTATLPDNTIHDKVDSASSNDCGGPTIGHCDTATLPDNTIPDKVDSDSSNDCGGLMVGHCDTVTLPENTIHDKVDSASSNDCGGPTIGHCDTATLPDNTIHDKVDSASSNDCGGPTIGHCDTATLPDNTIPDKVDSDSSNDCGGLMVGHCDTVTLPENTIHDKVDSASSNDCGGLMVGHCDTVTLPLPLPDKTIHDKVDSASSNDCGGLMVGHCDTVTLPDNTIHAKVGSASLNDCGGLMVGHCNTATLPENTIHDKVDSDEDEYICVTDDDETCYDSKWDTSDDLPLMANVDEVLVTHYVLNLSVNFSDKVMRGDITLFLKPATECVTQRQFQLCLDCSLVDIESVEEIDLKDDFGVRHYGAPSEQNDHTKCCPLPPDVFQVDRKVPVALPYTLLPYAVRNWCVRIWKPSTPGKAWPRCIRIKYCTRPEGKSLTWVTDQDNRPCVFSPGAYINNRSLMPCQEPPIAMSTWQAAIHVPRGCRVLMSGDELPVQNSDDADVATFLYEMNIPLPCSTLALAIGWFEYRETSTVALLSTISCRVFSAASVINEASEELLPRCAKYVSAACELLGPYPFTKMDLVILPRCFACMGLMSPNMAFLSQSILARDGSMCTRVAHEISHSWFGLLIGAKDWSEEWLSEGFATYMEERILCKAECLEDDKELFYVELCQILKRRTLLAEFQHADESMQCLRPKLPSVVTAAEAVRLSMEKEKSSPEDRSDDVVAHTTVTNGQVCSKKWSQIYYLKGYFLLHYMASLVGVKNFDNFLKQYVMEYGGKLVNSEEFFEYFEKQFTSLGKENIKDRLIQEWLEKHGLPVHVPKKIGRADNHLINQVDSEFGFWKKTDAVNKRKKTQHIRSKKPIKDHPKVNDQIQLVVLLERLLERDAMATATLTQLDNCYHFIDKNSEVRHRWCELVVKHRYHPGYPQVKRFLIEDQGMGIYLFGELLISQQPKQKQLVLDVLSIIGAEMDQCTLKTVQDMLEGRD